VSSATDARPAPVDDARAAPATNTLPAAIILGGSTNAVSIARSLGRRGIRVFVSVADERHALFSRYCTKRFPYKRDAEAAGFWRQLLLGPDAATLHGSVLLPCNDEAVTFVARTREELRHHYILDDSVPDLQLAMIDKRRTLTLAQEVNVDAPRFWMVDGAADLEAVLGDLRYPLIVKPLLSHLFQAKFGRKYFNAGNAVEVRAALERVWAAGLRAMICEWIPGPDSLLSSYYTYIDRDDKPLFHFTKKVIRRFPKNEGLTSYHITDWDPEVAAEGLRFLAGIKFRGLANVEFKRDLRDGRLKLVECNVRFTAPQELFVRCGLDTASIVYNHLVGLPLPPTHSYRTDVRLWHPIRDFWAFRQLHRLNELTLGEWIKSIAHWQALPYFQWTDPMPTLMPAARSVARRLRLVR
jgi:predicted ATP-grasp superfamily ATP-dependent carboligase